MNKDIKRSRLLLALAFALSGFSSLAYQTAWQRVLTQVIGSDSISSVLTVAIFMIWLGLGAELARRLLPRFPGRIATCYAAIEIAIGLSALFSIPTLRWANVWFATLGFESVYLDFVLNLLLLALPVIGMGMTTPLVVEVAKNRLSNLGATIGLFYGINILGAAIGSFLTGLLLIELLGLNGVTTLAAITNIMIGLLVLLAFRGGSIRASDYKTTERARFGFRFVLASIAFGFCSLALQIVFFRVLSNYFTLSSVVFPIVLSVYLLLMAAGQTIGGRLADKFSEKLPQLMLVLFVSGVSLLLVSLHFPIAFSAAMGALRFTAFNGQLLTAEHAELIGDAPPLNIFVFSALFMAAVLPWTALFPVMLRLVTVNIAHAGNQFATLYSFYTLGNVVGAIVSGVILFEFVGTAGAAISIIVTGALGALLIITGNGVRISAWRAIAGCMIVGTAVLAVPRDIYRSFSIDNYAISQVVEGRIGVASVVPTSRFYTIIDMNRTASASALSRDPAATDEYEAWRWNHTELFALDPTFRPKTVLIIGIGHGYLVDALLDLPFIEKITVVDLSPEVIEAVRTNTKTSTVRIFSDPRVSIVAEDGRRFIQKALARGERYDLIQNKINEPWHAGSGNLFTVEFLRTERALLSDGGYLGLRPVVGHVADALQVFDTAIWPGYYHMFFKNGHFELPEKAVVTPEIADAWYSALPGHPDAKTLRAATLDVVVLKQHAFESRVHHNTDDRPTFEYYWLRRILGEPAVERENLWYLKLAPVQVPVAIVND